MRIYPDDLERTIGVQRLAREWMRRGIVSPAQHEKIAADVQVDVRRTNRFLRVTLFGFAVLIIAAAVGLAWVVTGVNDSAPAGALCLCAATACTGLVELLIRRFRLYHFGVEEAAAVAAAVLVGAAGGLFSSHWPGNAAAIVALAAGAVAALAVYVRYGYLYAAIGAMGCAGLIAFQLRAPAVMQHVIAAAVFGGCALAARARHRAHGDEFPGDQYAAIEASAWIGGYLSLNLQIAPLPAPTSGSFYWLTFAMIWILPAAGWWLSVRDRHRLLLDASLVMTLATMLTTKLYLHRVARPWDPIVLAVLLIGTAVAVRKWLATGDADSHRGFTGLAAMSFLTAPGVAHAHPQASSPDLFDGGRSGGAGGGAAF
jgi:hypothetical protein